MYFLCARSDAREVIELFQSKQRIAKKVTIAGGGNIGAALAEALESYTHVKLIEENAERANALASKLSRSLILHGDCTDETLLFEENIDKTDLFCALTNDDQTNIMAAMLAKRLGAKFSMALINRSSYLEMIEEESNIDLAFSPQQVTLSTLLTYIRKGDIVQVYSLRSGESEAMEIIAHGNAETSKIVGKSLEGIRWPENVVVAGLIRRGKVMKIEPSISIEQNDHLILFITDKESIPEVEDLFELRK
ncbi:Trk system potassium transporter TrkA [Ignatzschineria indica]|uniref:Trk system potassium transporter TrkA n=1 Tax=Ignatzschineria indica TaxID=472583 RepID=UPI00362E8663